MYYICLEIGGTNLRYGLYTKCGKRLDFKKTLTKNLSKSDNKPNYIHDLIRPYLLEYNKDIIAIGISVASLLDRSKSQIYSSPMIKGFDNIALKKELEELTKKKVVLEKDVNALLVKDIRDYSLSDSMSVVGVYFGTGIGNAMYLNGQIYSGYSGAAGELGHFNILGNNNECGCGKSGCIETIASGRILERIAVECNVPVQMIFNDAKTKDNKEIQNIVEHFALSLATEITIIDPEYVIIGGGLVDMIGFPREDLVKNTREMLRKPNPRETTKFIFSKNKDDAGIQGMIEIMNRE